MTIYSHSRLSTFEQCPFKFKLKYLDKIKPIIEKTIEAHLGSVVHDTLEWIYNSVKQNPNKTITIDEIITHYSVKWQDEFSEEILIVKKELSAKDYFNKGVMFLVNYYTKYQPFKDGTIECEKRILIDLDKDKKIQGFIDRLVYDKENDNYEIHDYKTARTLPTQEKMDNDRQLALYSIAIKEKVGKDKEVVLIWHYLAHNQKITSKRTNEQLEELKKEIIELIEKIESTKDFPANKSILCNWCEYKPMCILWNPNSPYSHCIEQKELNDFPEIKIKETEFLEKEEDQEEVLDIW